MDKNSSYSFILKEHARSLLKCLHAEGIETRTGAKIVRKLWGIYNTVQEIERYGFLPHHRAFIEEACNSFEIGKQKLNLATAVRHYLEEDLRTGESTEAIQETLV